MTDAILRCRCGQVEGRVRDASPRNANRLVCYCDDCQRFVRHLGREDLLDPHGGSDIVQVAPASLSFEKGDDRVVGLRLTPKGLYRHYTSCCNTPVGNTTAPAIPFVGILASAFVDPSVFGAPIGAVQRKFAIGTPPPGSDVRVILRSIRKILGWKLRGRVWPHPFFDRRTKKPTRPLTVLS